MSLMTLMVNTKRPTPTDICIFKKIAIIIYIFVLRSLRLLRTLSSLMTLRTLRWFK